MYGERKDKSVEGSPWSDKRFNTAPAATGGDGPKSSWNVRFDHKPMNMGRTYDGKKMAEIGPAPGNKAKV